MRNKALLIVGRLPDQNCHVLEGQNRVTINYAKHMNVPYSLITIRKGERFYDQLFSTKSIEKQRFGLTYNELSILGIVIYLFRHHSVFITSGYYYAVLAGFVKFCKLGKLIIYYRSGGFIYLERKIAKELKESPRNRFYNVWLEYIAFRLSDIIIVNSNLYRDKLRSIYPLTASKLIVIPNGIDEAFLSFNPTPLPRSDNKIRFLSVSGLYGVKGIDNLVKLYAALKLEMPSELVIIGSGLPKIKKWIYHYKETNSLMFLDKEITILEKVGIKDLVNFFRASDFYLQLSRWDAGPSSVIEAFYFNLPLLISKHVGTHPEIYNSSQCHIYDMENDNLTTELRESLKFSIGRKRNFQDNSFMQWDHVLSEFHEYLSKHRRSGDD